MTATVHRILITVGSFLGGLTAIWQMSEVEPLGIPVVFGSITALSAAIVMLLANAIRANWPLEVKVVPE